MENTELPDAVHIVSATAVCVDGATHHLSMCGVDLGNYAEASKIHPVGNYLSTTSPDMARVTCDACRATRTGGRLISTDTGAVIEPGATVADFHGESWQFVSITRPAGGNSTGRVLISRPCDHTKEDHERIYWCRGEDQREVFPSVIEAHIEA